MPGELIVTAPNGVQWRRDPGATSTPAQLFAAMDLLTTDWHERQWNWWREGQIEAEERKARAIWHEWDHADSPPGGYQYGSSMEEAVAAVEAEWDAQRAGRERARLAQVPHIACLRRDQAGGELTARRFTAVVPRSEGKPNCHLKPSDHVVKLERLHVGMRKVDVPSPRFTDRIAEAEEVVANPDLSPELDDADRVFLSSRLGSLRRAIDDRAASRQCAQHEEWPVVHRP